MTNRRKFIKQVSAAAIATSMPNVLLSQPKKSDNKIWANLLHLSYNAWEDHIPEKYKDENFKCNTCLDARLWAHGYRPNLTFDDITWNNLLKEMADVGMNMVLIDVEETREENKRRLGTIILRGNNVVSISLL